MRSGKLGGNKLEKLMLGIQVAVVGMVVVFLALIALAFFTEAMSRVLGEKMPKHLRDFQQVNKVAAPTIEKPVQSVKAELTPEIIAVITAAVASTMNSPRNTYTITTIKRADYDLSPSWSRLGRYEQTI